MAFIVCELRGDYGIDAKINKIFLWGEKAGIFWFDNSYDGKCYTDDFANNTILLWSGVVDFSGGEPLILPTLSVAMGLTFLTGVVCGFPIVEMIVYWCALKILDFHILVVDFFAGMEQFLVKIEPYQAWVFLIYGVILVVLFLAFLRNKRNNNMVK